MLKEERQDLILYKVSTAGKVIASKLAVELDVSEDTVRRDLLELDRKGQLKRVYGGALPLNRPVVNYLDRENKDIERKLQLAEKARRFLENDQLVAIDGSSTNLQFARSIPKELRLTVVTNSYPIAQACSDNNKIEILIIGGKLLRETMTNVGDIAEKQAKLYHPDLCIMGVYAMHPEYGMTIPYREEVSIKRQMVESSSKVISLVNPAKLNTVSKYHVCGMEAFTALVTEDTVSEQSLALYRDRGLECI